MESFDLDLLQGFVSGDAGIVDDDVELELARFRVGVVVLRDRYEMRRTGRIPQVSLGGDRIDTIRRSDIGRDLLSLGGRSFGGVVKDDGAAFGGEIMGDSSTEA